MPPYNQRITPVSGYGDEDGAGGHLAEGLVCSACGPSAEGVEDEGGDGIAEEGGFVEGEVVCCVRREDVVQDSERHCRRCNARSGRKISYEDPIFNWSPSDPGCRRAEPHKVAGYFGVLALHLRGTFASWTYLKELFLYIGVIMYVGKSS